MEPEGRLDGLDHALPSCDTPGLIKIDVESGEEAVIEGAIDTLRRYRALVLFEQRRRLRRRLQDHPSRIYELLVEQVSDADLRHGRATPLHA